MSLAASFPLPRLAANAHIVILTGAGMSADSGVKTFRDAGGLWEGERVEDVATPEAFARNPAKVQQFYNQRRRQLAEVSPNAGHLALAQLERAWPGTVTLITQNVDDLHQRAGSRNLYAMHGELLLHRCVRCAAVGKRPATDADLDALSVCAACGATGTLRPHIVWFGEMPLFMNNIEAALEDADLFIAIGTSGLVYPAAGFVQLARAHGAFTVEINRDDSAVSSVFDARIVGKAGDVVPRVVEGLIGGCFLISTIWIWSN